MWEWNPQQYLLFQKQRTQPAVDLANRVRERDVRTVMDLGCGPGNSTAVLQSVFPNARITGMDSSPVMIERARREHPDMDFQVGRVEELTGAFDLLFSNACLQWVPHHETLLPKLMEHLTDHGVLAVQMPRNQEEPLFRIIRQVAADSQWDFSKVYFERNDTLTPSQYHEILSGCAGAFELWETVYYHLLPSHRHLLEWVRGTRLRPYLEVLNRQQQKEFEQEILEKAQQAYPLTKDGTVIFPFRRFFFVAEK